MTDSRVPAAGRYVTFHLGDSHYAVPVTAVREVVRLCPITPVPQMPDYIRGVINLRGTVLAVIDLRAKFQMLPIDYNDRACILVFEHLPGGRATQIGALVDSVDDVVQFAAAQLAVPPNFAGSVDARFLAGVAISPERVRAVLALDEILAADAAVSIPDLQSLSTPPGHGFT
jgi:purine-binding chemotaxis protein CheW